MALVRLPTRLRTSPAVTFRPEQEAQVRAIVREEIASLAGKALRRTQDLEFSRSPERNLALEVANEQAAQLWGEVLAEYRREES
ncbi:MAG: hypothetical protein K0S82_86 [Gaiellaceae bacterium]|nr:hypothetical protein [Gaiellaceae bacterium]